MRSPTLIHPGSASHVPLLPVMQAVGQPGTASAPHAVTPAQVHQACSRAGEFMQTLEARSLDPLPWAAGGSHAAGNHQSLIALAGLMRDQIMARTTPAAPDTLHLGEPRPMRGRDLLQEAGVRGLQLFLDVGTGFGAHQLINAVMDNHNLYGQPHSGSTPPAGPANATGPASQPVDVGSLFAGSNLLGFAAPAFVSGSAAYMAGHAVGALMDSPRTSGPAGSGPVTRHLHEQAQNLLFNLPGMIGGFTAANLALSAMKAPHPAAEWLLWSLGGALGGAAGGAMNFAYRCAVMGHEVQQPDRSWSEKLSQLKKLDLAEWTRFVPAHLASLTPIQFKGAASAVLLPGDGYGQTLARRSANTAVLQGSFAALHGPVQKLTAGAMALASRLGEFCHDRSHACHPRGDSTAQAEQIGHFLQGRADDLGELGRQLEQLIHTLRQGDGASGPLQEPLRRLESSLGTMSLLQQAPPARNGQGEPTRAHDIDQWTQAARGDFNAALDDLVRLTQPQEARPLTTSV